MTGLDGPSFGHIHTPCRSSTKHKGFPVYGGFSIEDIYYTKKVVNLIYFVVETVGVGGKEKVR